MLQNTQTDTTKTEEKYDNTNTGAAWTKKDKNGNDYYLGSVDVEGKTFGISIHTNGFKQNDSHPDVRILINTNFKGK